MLCVHFVIIVLLGCVDDYRCYAVMATIYSKLHDAANTITACQKGCDFAVVTLIVRMQFSIRVDKHLCSFAAKSSIMFFKVSTIHH